MEEQANNNTIEISEKNHSLVDKSSTVEIQPNNETIVLEDERVSEVKQELSEKEGQNKIENSMPTENSGDNEDQGQMLKENPLNLKDLIFGSHLLRGAFSEDVFKGITKPISEDQPLFSIKNQDFTKTAATATLEGKDITLPEEPDEKSTPFGRFNTQKHSQKVCEIADMIQRNK